MKLNKVRKKQFLIFFVISILGAAGGIIHGIYFDLDFSQIQRLSLLGVIFTAIIIFPAILFFEYIFDWNNQEELNHLKEKLHSLERDIKILKKSSSK